MRFLFQTVVISGVAALAVMAQTPNAAAQGASCAALAGTGGNAAPAFLFPGSGTFVFEQGDVLTFSGTRNTGGPNNLAVTITATGVTEVASAINVADGETVTITFTVVTAATDYGFTATAAVGGDADFTFVGCSGGSSSEERQQAQAQTAARASFAQQSGLVFQRTNNLLLNKPENRARISAAAAQTSVLPQAGVLGQAGQAGGSFGVWADFTWTGIENDDAAVGSDTNAFTLSGGYDTALSDRLIVGAAISFGGATFDPKGSDDSQHEVNFGITPYAAYQLDDVFALQAAAGYTHARGFADINGSDGDYGTNRYFVAGEASAFQTWGEFSVFASVGVLWGQSLQEAFTTDDGQNRFGSVKTSLGSVSVTAQPSYLFTVDATEGVFLEPFLLGQYSYDFAIDKIADTANDRDAFTLGVGVNGFSGDGLSGSVEFTRTIGREDETATSARATVRLDF